MISSTYREISQCGSPRLDGRPTVPAPMAPLFPTPLTKNGICARSWNGHPASLLCSLGSMLSRPYTKMGLNGATSRAT